MKIYSAFIVMWITLFNSACKKQSASDTLINVELDNAQLSVVKNYISGKWKLVYTDGGFSPHVTYMQNSYFEFKANDILIETYNNDTLVNDTINWVRYPTGNDTINIMTYEDVYTFTYSEIPLKIYDDTLIIRDVGPDGLTYHLVKN